MITLLIPVIFFGVFIYMILTNDKELEEKNKAYTELSIKILIIVFFSIVASVVISLQKEIPASSGHGGFVYIIIPAMIGSLVFFLYLISLTIDPKRKISLGIISVMLNLVTGMICSITEF